MAHIPTPRPKPAKKPKKSAKRKLTGICPQCAFIFKDKEVCHYDDCPQEHDLIVFHKRKTNKQMYEAGLDYMCRLITLWRDACVCVIGNSRNVHCSDISQWGHVIPQGKSAYLVYELSNSFRQCSTHNLLHRSVNAPYYDWYKETWGETAYKLLISTWEDNKKGLSEAELRELLIKYSDLYAKRNQFDSLDERIRVGYYGQIIPEARYTDMLRERKELREREKI